MGIENGGVFRSDRFRDALLHLENLHARLNEGSFEAPDFIRDLGRRDAVTRDVVQLVANDVNLAAGDSRRDARSFKPNFLSRVVAAHPPARVMADVKLAKAARASARQRINLR